MAIALVLATSAVVAGVLALRGPRAAPDLPALTLEVSTAPTDDPSTALSVDGTQLAFIANRDRVPVVWVRSLAAGESRPLPGTEGASFPFWSPDGRSLGFFANDKLKRIDVAGGVPLVVADAPNARGGTWNADGVILFAPGVAAPIVRVPARGGPVEAVTQQNAGSGSAHRLPQFMPDGKRFLFSSALGTEETNGVYIGSLDKTPPVRLVPGDTGGRFAAPDKLLTVGRGRAANVQRRVCHRGRRTGRHRAGLHRRGREPRVCLVRHRCAGLPFRRRAAPPAGVGQSAGRRARAIGEPDTTSSPRRS